MGILYSPNNRSLDLIMKAFEKIEKIGADIFKEKWKEHIYYRPLRPDDLNPAFIVATRDYSTLVSATDTTLVGAPVSITVPNESAIMIYGWIVKTEPAARLSPQSLIQIFVNTNFKSEICPYVLQDTEDNIWIDSKQFTTFLSNDRFNIVIRDPGLLLGATIRILVWPLAVFCEIVTRSTVV